MRTLSVVANPWTAIDHKGRPAGVVLRESAAVGSHHGFVGARFNRAETKIIKAPKDEGSPQDAVQNTVWDFSPEPVTVPDSAYYRRKLRTGELLPGDEHAAQVARHARFIPPAEALEIAERAAVANFDACYGAGAFERAAKAREAEAAEAAKVAEAATEGPALRHGNLAPAMRQKDEPKRSGSGGSASGPKGGATTDTNPGSGNK